MWNVLLTMCQEISSLPGNVKLVRIREARVTLIGMQRLLAQDPSLSEEKAFVNDLVVGIDLAMRSSQVDTAAIWIQDKLLSVTEEGNQSNRGDIVKQLNDINKFVAGPKSRGYDQAAWASSPMQPVSLSHHFGGFGAPPAWMDAPAVAAPSQHGHYTAGPNPPSRSQQNRGGGGDGGGGGGHTARKPALCRKCRNAGKTGNEIMHSFRACPLTKCRKCGMFGHIDRYCPN